MRTEVKVFPNFPVFSVDNWIVAKRKSNEADPLPNIDRLLGSGEMVEPKEAA